MSKIEIDGWECHATESTQGQPLRVAKRYGNSSVWYIQYQSDGSLSGSGAGIGIPRAVLAWLVAPLIDDGYALGYAAAKATAAAGAPATGEVDWAGNPLPDDGTIA